MRPTLVPPGLVFFGSTTMTVSGSAGDNFLALLVPRGVVTLGPPQPLCVVFCCLRGSAPVGRKGGLTSPLTAASGFVRCSRGREPLGPAPPPRGGPHYSGPQYRGSLGWAASPDRTDHAAAPGSTRGPGLSG
ncbi:hypothetical protein NDU88_002330 [Pleurodeles waltl]|uniref:Uncharacterized protein n=1 Tax=Pleurodeles waltl TaxID=8319 RepID=A0AAV7L3C1_PLEWA|nr:hypothetical protein NDU88_002330 [Pleurodeles waltl]